MPQTRGYWCPSGRGGWGAAELPWQLTARRGSWALGRAECRTRGSGTAGSAGTSDRSPSKKKGRGRGFLRAPSVVVRGAYLPPFLAFSSKALARLARSALPTAPATFVSGSTSFGALAPA